MKLNRTSFRPPSLKSIYKKFIRGTYSFRYTKAFNPDKLPNYNRPKKKHDENYRIKRSNQRRRQRADRNEILRQQRGEEAGSALPLEFRTKQLMQP
jgi:hypothetical protein